ncbi:MAG TPA: 3-hydroxyisobutyrate dehydrogenase [Ferrovibrio sp.]|jgi:3-hydroxyisobutyrate dehydrogenase|uniref:3-hydroxyisobutyrate dehydrogenase n=1 Tax=Ferrovibrio sp. TaxID=1917215 RepID=UPI002B4B75D1|nr:3-hydroxyisobutyrate dehydrogenase [Ferrovibrio sp.]HLT78052.1 3-hydroxyisobutyrate dehydrogenase [Ferrovibrio sp.]
MAVIGFIGVGNMGGPMARNLLKAGHQVKAFDLSAELVQKVVDAGGTKAGSAQEAATDVDAVITMLPAGKHVASVYTGDKGILATARPGTLFIDSSTIDVKTAREVIAAAEARGMLMVDAPVSGGVAGAENATLTFMVGGTEAAFAKAKPLLEAMGKKIVHAGGAGNGQVAKICNNMVLGISMIAVSEAFVMAEKLGLSAQAMFDIVSSSSGSCWALVNHCPVPGPVPTSAANRDYKPGFAADLMLKDLKLSQEAARTAKVNTPLGAEATALFAEYVEAGNGPTDYSGIVRMIREMAG